MKKIISIALALLMVAVMLPVMAMAEGTKTRLIRLLMPLQLRLIKIIKEDITLDKALMN